MRFFIEVNTSMEWKEVENIFFNADLNSFMPCLKYFVVGEDY
jgi:hypothetical protein